MRSDQHIDFELLAINFNGHYDTGRGRRFETRMHQSFIQIQQQRLLAIRPGTLRRQQALSLVLLDVRAAVESLSIVGRSSNHSRSRNQRLIRSLWNLGDEVA